MIKSKPFAGCVVLAVTSFLFNVAASEAQTFSIPWYTIDGGGGYSAGGAFEVEGTIGQHDAGQPMSGGNFEVTGGFWVGTDLQGPVVLVPTSFLVTRGTYVSGGVAELAASDNADLAIRRATNDIQSRTEFELKTFSSIANPSSLAVALEGAVFARSAVTQNIELYNYVSGNWETIDSRAASRFSDAVARAVATGDLSRFVEAGTMCMEARVRYQSTNPRQQFSSNTDQFVWNIGQ